MKIAIGNDHVAVEMKNHIKAYLESKGHEVINYGTDSEERTDYPIYGERVARAVASGECDKGVLICGTGIGISLAANKVKGIRAAVCSESYSAKLTVQHNNANIIAFGARVIGIATAEEIVDAFFSAEFEGGRHLKRVEMLSSIEER
ncbi:MAG: ribose 5-phosphate isomerase B [Clostridia bacterium]|nr:ribose 5-phosphate isomerase B [Clostridia bacterium]